MQERYHDDEMLIARAQEGDQNSFNQLIRKHEERAYHYAFRLTRNSEEASDVVSEAFLRVYNALHNFKGQSAFTTWLYRILTNCYLDVKKRDRTRLHVSLESSFGGINGREGEVERQIKDPAPTPDLTVEKSERERSVTEAVGMLSEYHRAMVIMYHVENLSYEDISAALDLPIGTVKSRLNRARLNLRELLLRNEELFKL